MHTIKDNLFTEDIPSKRVELLTKILNAKVSKLQQYSWDNPEKAAGITKELEQQRDPALMFFRTSEPMLITLESGLVIGFGSIPSEASVTVWLEETELGERDEEESIIDASDFFVVDATDPIYSDSYFSQLPGKKIISVKILKQEPKNILFEDLPREAGVMLGFEGGTELVMSHGLHNDSDTFSVIFHHEILPDSFGKLQEISVT
jgi:hypothetical protein